MKILSKQTLARNLAVAITTFTLLFVSHSEAYAKTGCYGATCRGKNPAKMGCDRDARTLATAYDPDFKVELRFSRHCNARWARTTYRHPFDFPFWIYAQLGSGAVTQVSGPVPVQWSLMWTGAIKACGGAPGGESPFPGTTIVCTVAR